MGELQEAWAWLDAEPDVIELAMGRKAPSTQKAYSVVWSRFEIWCRAHEVSSLPASPEAVTGFLTFSAERGLKLGTLEHYRCAISRVHAEMGHPNPTEDRQVRSAMRGLRHQLSGEKKSQKAPLLPETLLSVLGSLPGGLAGIRNKAVLLLGFAGAFRRSELTGLQISDLEFGSDGLGVTLQRSKTDQEGLGRDVFIPTGSEVSCPVKATRQWLDSANLQVGSVFRQIDRYGHIRGEGLSGRTIARIVQQSVKAVGLDSSQFGGNSLRSGLVTAATRAGKCYRDIQKTTGHRTLIGVDIYVRGEFIPEENAADGLL